MVLIIILIETIKSIKQIGPLVKPQEAPRPEESKI